MLLDYMFIFGVALRYFKTLVKVELECKTSSLEMSVVTLELTRKNNQYKKCTKNPSKAVVGY